MARKPEVLHEKRAVNYDEVHWKTLARLRERAADILLPLQEGGIKSHVYGSLARGDVSKSSDIDIIVPHAVSSYRIEIILSFGTRRELVQATPSSVLKGHLHLDNEIVVSFPMFKMMSREREFYQWGGMINLDDILNHNRVPGVDKRLILIEPTERGHIEQGVIGYESYAAKKLGVSVSIAQERTRVLARRDEVGRTGVYRTYLLKDDETFEEAAKSLADSDPALRRTIKRRE
ncbi:MAG: nucleotidyltransferase domain-containing protein [Candidatus Thorarchaeota archaeon]|nr:nucleotidyltransferase domain-containing protein [Candidatus Thorarchaeota archaeon]